jgi:uncharacterized repeat protein (TIGR01451 family)
MTTASLSGRTISVVAQSHSPLGRRSAAIAGIVVAVALVAPAMAEATTDSYTAIGKRAWIVPPGVTQLTVEVTGAGGGTDSGGNGCKPGTGATLAGTLQVVPGAQLTIDVGGRGGNAPLTGTGGGAGGGGDLHGGAGGSAGVSGPVGGGGGGGGTMISSTSGPLVVAGGGGGCGGFANGFGLGDGGNHGVAGGEGSQSAHGGGAGTSFSVGSGGASDPSTEPAGAPGSADVGGAGAGAPALHFGGGGGGGGYAGGGGGGGAEPIHGIAGGGGGGGDLAAADVTVGTQEETGNGHVTITYTSSWQGTTVGNLFVPKLAFNLNNLGHFTMLQTGVDTGSPWIVPSSGVITSWGFEASSGVPDSIEFKVGRGQRDPLGAGDFTTIASSQAGTLVPNQLNTYDVRIPVQQGDVLGSYQSGATGYYDKTTFFPHYAARGTGDAAQGSTQHYNDTSGEDGLKVPIVALVEPDADGDGFGDLSQDRCVGVPGGANGCPVADLSVTATANATSVTVGQAVIYTLTATNNGPDPAAVTITDPLPAGAKFLSATPNGGTCVAGPPVKCDFGAVASGGSASATVVVEATQAGSLSNTASVAGPAVPAGSGAGDPNPANDSATATTDVTATGTGGSPGGGSPSGGSPGSGTPGSGTPGSGTPGSGTPGAAAFKGVKIVLKHGAIDVKKRVARIKLTSALAAKGNFKLTTTTGKGKKRRTIVLGRASFTVRAGKSHTVVLHLGRTKLKLLKTNRSARNVLAVAVASHNGGATKTARKHAKLKLL